MNIEKFKELYKHNKFFAVAVIVAIGAGLWLLGCHSKTISPFDNAPVTREELIAQADYYKHKLELAFQDLDKQDAFKQYLVNTVLNVVEGGTLNPSGIALGLLGILGIGAVADNRRKDTVIKTKSNQLSALTAKITLPNVDANVNING